MRFRDGTALFVHGVAALHDFTAHIDPESHGSS